MLDNLHKTEDGWFRLREKTEAGKRKRPNLLRNPTAVYPSREARAVQFARARQHSKREHSATLASL